jgi:hypothetical protein
MITSSMRRQGSLLPLALIASLACTGAADAGSARFVRAVASGPDISGSLTLTIKMVALGGAVTTSINGFADATAVYGCANPSGDITTGPWGPREVSDRVRESGEFTSERNGQITGDVFLNPPPDSLQCPDALRRVLISVSYSNAEVCSDLGGCANIPGIFRRTFHQAGTS